MKFEKGQIVEIKQSDFGHDYFTGKAEIIDTAKNNVLVEFFNGTKGEWWFHEQRVRLVVD